MSRAEPQNRAQRRAPQPETPPALLRIRPAAEYMGVTERFMRRLVEQRRIRHFKVGQFVMFQRSDLDDYLAASVREAVA